MILPYKYPNGRISRHARFEINQWNSSIDVVDIALMFRTKEWFFGYRYRFNRGTRKSFSPSPSPEQLEECMKKVEQQWRENREEKIHIRIFRRFLQKMDSE